MVLHQKSGSKDETLVRQLNELTERLDDIRANYGFVESEQAIESLIYEENAILCRLDALIREARENGVSVQLFERLNNKDR